MTVTVVNREAIDRAWGTPGMYEVYRKTVTIADTCPVCGGPRGKPELRQFCEEGIFYSVHCWQNPCGHIDHYPDVLKEAAGN
jgi:hypothetical protein